MGVLRVACRGVVCGNRRLYGGMIGLKCLGGGGGWKMETWPQTAFWVMGLVWQQLCNMP